MSRGAALLKLPLFIINYSLNTSASAPTGAEALVNMEDLSRQSILCLRRILIFCL